MGQRSDHAFLSFHYSLRHRHEFRWIKRKFRKITSEAEESFSRDLENVDWVADVAKDGLNAAVDYFHETLQALYPFFTRD